MMRLVDKDLELAVVYPDVETADYNGNPVRQPDMDGGVNVRLRVKTPDATEAAFEGQSVASIVRVMSPTPIPAGAFSVVRLRGRLWDVEGEVARHRRTSATAHDAMTLIARGSPERLGDPRGGV